MSLISTPARLLCAMIALLVLSGCDKYAEDKAQIKVLWDEWDRVNEESDGAGAVSVYSAASFKWYDDLLKKALDAPAKQVWEMTPTQMGEVLLIRHRGKRKDLKGLDGRGYVKYATGQGWYVSDGGLWAVKDVKVLSDWAEAKMFDEEWAAAYRDQRMDDLFSRRRRFRGGRIPPPPEYTVKFVREGGEWRIDETSLHPVFDEIIADAAKEEQMSIRDFLMSMEQMDSEDEIKMSVWEPMKK